MQQYYIPIWYFYYATNTYINNNTDFLNSIQTKHDCIRLPGNLTDSSYGESAAVIEDGVSDGILDGVSAAGKTSGALQKASSRVSEMMPYVLNDISPQKKAVVYLAGPTFVFLQ